MVLTVLALLVGIGLGFAELARRGATDLTGWKPWHHVAQPWLIGVGIVLQGLAETFGGLPLRRSVLVIGVFALIVGLAGNLFRLGGAGVTIVGLTANLAALVANGHVPVRLEALIGAGKVDATVDPTALTLNGGLAELETADTNLAFLGDIVPLPVVGDVVSFGDLIVLAGLVFLARSVLLTATARRPRPARRRPAEVDETAPLDTAPLDTTPLDDGLIDVDDFLIDLRDAALAPGPEEDEELQPARTMSVDELLGPDPSPGSSTPPTER